MTQMFHYCGCPPPCCLTSEKLSLVGLVPLPLLLLSFVETGLFFYSCPVHTFSLAVLNFLADLERNDPLTLTFRKFLFPNKFNENQLVPLKDLDHRQVNETSHHRKCIPSRINLSQLKITT